ncbi:MAG: hypothetical protein ACLP9C_10530 [Acidimicrobiales bacterium]
MAGSRTRRAGGVAALAVSAAVSFALVDLPAGASPQSLAWLTSQAQPAAAKLQADQAAVSAATGAHGHWVARLSACQQLVRDAQSAKKGAPAPTQGLRSAWKALVVADLEYSQACVSWAKSKGTRNGGSVQVLGQQLTTAQAAWKSAVAAAQSSTAAGGSPPTSTTTTTAPQTEAQYEASCSLLMPYSELVTQSTANATTCVTEQGTVYQYDNNTGPNDMLVAVANNSADLMDVSMATPPAANTVGVNDVIQVWGPIAGSDTYSDSSGNNFNVPVVSGTYLTVVSAPAG